MTRTKQTSMRAAGTIAQKTLAYKTGGKHAKLTGKTPGKTPMLGGIKKPHRYFFF